MKALPIIGIIIAVLLVAAGGLYFGLLRESDTVALLYVDSGEVQVDTGSGWNAAVDQMELSKNAKVKTLDGKASIVFFDQDVLTLQPNTEIILSQLSSNNIEIDQKSGETWNRVEKLAGREYTVSTPTSVATVRGTGFILGDDYLDVDDGTVNFKDKETGTSEDVAEFESAKNRDGKLEKGKLDKDALLRIREKIEKEIEHLQTTRERIIEKNPFLLKRAEKMGFSREKIRQSLKDMDEGKESIQDAQEKAPKIEKVQKVLRLTQRIANLQEKLAKVNERIASMQ